MYVAAENGAQGGRDQERGIMEHRIIQHLKVVNGEKSLFRQWHLMFTTTLGQFKGSYEEIVHKMAHEEDLGKEVDVVIQTLYSLYGDELWEASA